MSFCGLWLYISVRGIPGFFDDEGELIQSYFGERIPLSFMHLGDPLWQLSLPFVIVVRNPAACPEAWSRLAFGRMSEKSVEYDVYYVYKYLKDHISNSINPTQTYLQGQDI